MWKYVGPEDPTKCSAEEFTADGLLPRVQQVTKCASIEEKSFVRPYADDLPLPQVLVLGFVSDLIVVCLIVDDVLHLQGHVPLLSNPPQPENTEIRDEPDAAAVDGGAPSADAGESAG